MNQPSTRLIIGPSSCSKMYTLLYEIIEKENHKELDYILVLCPTIWINKIYNN